MQHLPFPPQQDMNLVKTACFALSNLARGENANHEALVKTGMIPPLLHHLREDTVSLSYRSVDN
jgi:hypothetical protein